MFSKQVVPVLVFLLAGCGPPANRVLEETIEQVYPLSSEGFVSIRNPEGSIHIYGADIGEVRLKAIKRAYTKARLDKIGINVSAQPSVVSIESIFPKQSQWDFSDRSGTIDYTLLVPQTATIEKVESLNGEIIIEGMRGARANASLEQGRFFFRDSFCSLNLVLGHGALIMIYRWWEQNTFSVQGRITQGNTVVFMPSEASFHLIAETKNGKIDTDFTDHDARSGDEAKKIDKVVGTNPAATLKIHAVAGNIKVSEQNP